MRRSTSLFVLCSYALVLVGCSGNSAFDSPIYNAPITYTSGNLKIHGLLSKPPGRGPFPLLLINHGWPGTARDVLFHMEYFTKNGFVTLASDYRGNGQSEGTGTFIKDEVDDLLGCLEYGRALPYVDPHRVGAWGISAGATMALLAASRTQAVRAVVSVQGPVELADCFKRWMEDRDKPNSEMLIGLSSIIGGAPDQVPNEWKVRSPLYVADRIKCPVLLIYGDQDDVVPADQGPRMEAALKKTGNGSVSLMMTPGVGHGLDAKSWAEVNKTTLSFFERELGTGGP